MSYATSLLAAYPSTYGPSTLLSDNLIRRPSFGDLYSPSVPYQSDDRLLSDDLAFNTINHGQTTYRTPLYTLPDSNSIFPATKYKNTTVPNHRKLFPSHESHDSLNDITEYSESLATASNTNTASSVARSINDNNNTLGQMSMFSLPAHNYTQEADNNDSNPQYKSTWSSNQQRKKVQPDENHPKPTFKQFKQQTIRAQPPPGQHKGQLVDKLNEDITPVQSPHAPAGPTKKPNNNHLQRNATIAQIEKQPASIDVQAWVDEASKEPLLDEKSAEQVWSVKIGQLHMVQAQREKDKAKSSRALPAPPKKVDNKPIVSKTKPSNNDTKSLEQPHQNQHESYFDSLFDGDFFRKPSTNNYSIDSSFKNSKATKSRLGNSLNNLTTTGPAKNPKNLAQKKVPRYEPPSVKRPPPVITTTSWRKQLPKQYPYDTLYPYYAYDEVTHREFLRKDADERFREALYKLRADRAEQQQKEINEKTAKRLHYGDYVRHLTKDALLQNAVKPSPWSDFMDVKKGNLYSLSQEEKKQLYKQSRSYGERVRYRNFAISYASDGPRSHRHSAPLTDDSQDSDSGNETPRQRMNHSDSKSHSRVSKRPGSGSTVKTTNKASTKSFNVRSNNRNVPNQASRTTVRTDRSYPNRPSEDEDDDPSTHDTNRKYKPKSNKKNVHYSMFDTPGRTTTSGDDTEHEINNHGQRNIRAKNRDKNEDLFTVREEKALQVHEGARFKKR